LWAKKASSGENKRFSSRGVPGFNRTGEPRQQFIMILMITGPDFSGGAAAPQTAGFRPYEADI
jgi:hypothetical protein